MPAPRQILGSAAKSKKQIRAEEAAREAEAKRAEAEAKRVRQQERQARELEREKAKHAARKAGRPGGGGGGVGAAPQSESGGAATGAGGAVAMGEDEADEEADAAEAFAELGALLEIDAIGELPAERRALLCAQDTLTSLPSEGDALLYAVPVCAPLSAMLSYRYKIKLTPGTSKRGKAAKQAVGMLAAAAGVARERDLMRALTDDELVRVMIGNVKLAAGGKMLQAQKKERKAAWKEKNAKDD